MVPHIIIENHVLPIFPMLPLIVHLDKTLCGIIGHLQAQVVPAVESGERIREPHSSTSPHGLEDKRLEIAPPSAPRFGAF